MEKWRCKTNPKKKVFVLEKTIGEVGTVYEGKKIYIIRDTYNLKGMLRISFLLLVGFYSMFASVSTSSGSMRYLWIFVTVGILYTVYLEHKYITRRVVLEYMFKKDYIKENIQHNILFEFLIEFKNNVKQFFNK